MPETLGNQSVLNSNETPCEVLVTGHFLHYHKGHEELIKYASQFGPIVIGLNGNKTNCAKYGREDWKTVEYRCVEFFNDARIANLVVFEEPTPTELIRRLKPKHYVKGPDYRDVELPEAEACREVGAQIHIHPGKKIANSSDLLKTRA